MALCDPAKSDCLGKHKAKPTEHRMRVALGMVAGGKTKCSAAREEAAKKKKTVEGQGPRSGASSSWDARRFGNQRKAVEVDGADSD